MLSTKNKFKNTILIIKKKRYIKKIKTTLLENLISLIALASTCDTFYFECYINFTVENV